MVDMSRYSVVIPCHNEADSIAEVLKSVEKILPEAEIIVVDDGSSDSTFEVVSNIPEVNIVRLERNRGKGIALLKGVEACESEFVIFMDGDGQDPPEDLLLLVEGIEKGFKFVNGSKFKGSMEPGAISKPNYYGNRFMSGLINLLFGASVTDSQSGFRAIKKNVIMDMDIRSVEYEIETEMLCKALKAGVDVLEVPVTRRARTGGTTGFRRIRNGTRVLLTIFKERFFR